MSIKITPSRLRNFVFGVEDSLVSTVGLLSGVATAGLSQRDIFLTGIVLIFVEAFSMGVGSSLIGGIIMFFSYAIAGFIPLTPYLVTTITTAFPLSIILTLISLFILGNISGSLSKTNIIKSGARMLIIGGIAILLGIVVGRIFDGNTQ